MSISFDRVSHHYDASRGIPAEVSAQITDCMLQQVAATPETHFFEPGIGTGRIALPFIQRGYSYTGIDISDRMMAELRHKVENIPHRLTLLQGDITALPFADNCFDVAIVVHLLHLIPNWQQALAEIRRVLKPNGVFLYSHGNVRPAEIATARTNPYWYAFEQQWQAILAQYDFQIQYGIAEAEVLQTLAAQGATLETLIPAQWRIPLTAETLLNSYQQRLFSPCWQVPDDIFVEAIAQLTQWCHQQYESLQVDLSVETQFKLVVVRNWADASLS